MSAPRVTLGRVAGVYGVKGWLRIDSQTRPAAKILQYKDWTLRQEGRSFQAAVVEGRAQGQGVVAQITGEGGQAISDRDEASRLIGAAIEVGREALPVLPKGQYYWVDLIGLQVVNTSGTLLGSVRDVTSNGAQDVLVVSDEAGVERLIPFVLKHIVRRVEIAEGRIVCAWEADF
jgi:16S rRNA processing protein RimM